MSNYRILAQACKELGVDISTMYTNKTLRQYIESKEAYVHDGASGQYNATGKEIKVVDVDKVRSNVSFVKWKYGKQERIASKPKADNNGKAT